MVSEIDTNLLRNVRDVLGIKVFIGRFLEKYPSKAKLKVQTITLI